MIKIINSNYCNYCNKKYDFKIKFKKKNILTIL